jgi:hypothetical protein
MKRITFASLIALLTAGCVHGANLEQVHAGMSRNEVVALIGQPEGSTNTEGRECSQYTVLKDFWSRVPWNMSDRYYVCYTDGRVDSFGRTDQDMTAGR